MTAKLLNQAELCAFVALIGGTNLGQSVVLARDFAPLLSVKTPDLNAAVQHLWGRLNETAEGADGEPYNVIEAFEEEAHGWLDRIKNEPEHLLRRRYPDHFEVLERARHVRDGQRFKDALFIQHGASNVTGILRSMHQAALEAMDADKNPRTDPALMLMLHQLAHVMDFTGFDCSLTAYRNATDACEAEVAKRQPKEDAKPNG